MTTAPVYADAWRHYVAAGWSGVLPLPPGEKSSPPKGYTGEAGRWPSLSEIERWAANEPDGNIALRLPPDVIGIDIDAYKGPDVRAALEALTGPLPPTWCTTSRVDGSGIRLYRVPAQPAHMGWATAPVPGVEIIQHRHRYAVVAPSLHPEGRTYFWVDESSGEVGDDPPEVDDLTELPWHAVDALSAQREPEQRREPAAFTITTGEMSPVVERRLRDALAATTGQKGSRHDAVRDDVLALLRYAERGETGVSTALAALRDAFISNVGPDRRPGHAAREFDELVAGGVRRVESTQGRIPTKAERDAEASGEWWFQVIRPGGQQGATKAVEPWPEPVPLRDATNLPPFPVDALPRWMGEHAAAVAAELQSPVDLPAMLGIAALSAVAAKQARVAVRGTWTEPANLYVVVAMPPSSGKSPAFGAMIGPLRDHERDEIARTAPAVAQREQQRRVLEKSMKKAEEKGDLDEAGRILLDLMGAEPIRPPRLMIDDATPEAVVKVLGEQHGRIAIMSPEGGLFDMMAGRYSEQSNLDPYLKAWSGDTIVVDRMGRDSVTIDSPSIVIGLAVQPSVIAALAERPEMAGRGLTARFMYAVPPDVVGKRNMIDPPLADPAIAAEYRRRLTALAARPRTEHAATLTLDDEARSLFLHWRQALEDQRGPFGDMRPMAEWTTKLESSVARLALLLHIANHGAATARIDADTMRRAIAVGEYWIEHGKAVHDLWAVDPVRSSALAILEWIRHRSIEEFTVRDLHRSMRRRFTRPGDLLEPLALLVDNGWLRPLFDGPLEVGKGGKASPAFAVHPKARVWNTSTCRTVSPVAPVSLKVDSEESSSSSTGESGLEPDDTGATGDTAPERLDRLADFEGLI